MKNYYKILEVSENASIEVIDKAYRVLVKKYHPDLQANNAVTEEKIREINEAYNVLSDDFLKEQYDKELRKQEQENIQNDFKENDYGRMYKEQQKLKYQLAHEKYDKERIARQKQEIEDEIGQDRADGMIALVKGLFKYRPTMESVKAIKRIDVFALILTIIIVITIGVILYWLPFTHDWMYRNFIDTPLLRWLVK